MGLFKRNQTIEEKNANNIQKATVKLEDIDYKKSIELIDKHIIQSESIGYFWIIYKDIIFGLSTMDAGKTTVNTTYLKNALRDNDPNFCAIELWSTADTKNLLNPEELNIQESDTDDEKAKKINDYIETHETPSEFFVPGDNVNTIRDFFSTIFAFLNTVAK